MIGAEFGTVIIAGFTMPVCEAARAEPPEDDGAEGNCAGMAHLSASIDIAATMAARNADDLGKASGALGVCLETLEYMMVLSTSISNVLDEVAASELARADLEHHFEQIVRIIGAFASLTGTVARDIAGDATMPVQAQGWAEKVNLLLERARQTTDEISPSLTQVTEQVRQVAGGLDRSREVAERSVRKAKSAHGFISSLRDQFDRNGRHMRDLATTLNRSLAQIGSKAEVVTLTPPQGRRGSVFAHAVIDDVAEATMSDLERVAMSVTDLFVSSSDKLDTGHVDVFGTLLSRLANDLATAARRRLSERLAPIPNAPHVVVANLAMDHDIAVARPVLVLSEALDDADLVRVARERGEDHMMAIAARATLSEAVTDTLVDRGSSRVVRVVAANEGARFSGRGYAALLEHARTDAVLATTLRARQDLPPAAFEKLLAQAAAVAARDIDAGSDDVRAAVDEIAHRAAEEIESRTRAFQAVRGEVHQLLVAGKLDESVVTQFVNEGRHDHVLAAIAELCNVPDDVVLRFAQSNGLDLLLIVAKAAHLGWPTVQAALRARIGGAELSAKDIAAAKEKFQRLIPATCERVVGFWKSRNGGTPGGK
ncbi:DUF2336 domain-containing protein [Blastochloris sulfoviridis]|uniref:DUF2336 domain-containing protein n=2 Tax=Blastochloris sulfoviridis TaxID=50712 RepID=A0A5M6HV93_9HYPH|nr:DUF2336 domain-containing protein [Blastochloris sulfoviridis]